MDTLDSSRTLIENVITEHARIPYAHADIEQQLIFDRSRDHYLLMLVGREGLRRVHGCLIHVDLKDGKFWIQRDGTEYGVARELVDAGVPKELIVLGFRPPEVRQYTEYAAC